MGQRVRNPHWQDFRITAFFLTGCALCGVLGIVIQGAIPSSTAYIMALAATAVGGFSGFLFGVPRSPGPKATSAGAASAVDPNRRPAAADGANADDANRTAQPDTPIVFSTNLEEIADWLTKILLGAGLTQLSQLPMALQHMAEQLGAAPEATPIIIGIWIIFIILGFFTGYLLTRLFLAGALIRATDPDSGIDNQMVLVGDRSVSLGKVVEQSRKSIADLNEHVAAQLDANSGEVRPTLSEQAGSAAGLNVNTMLWATQSADDDALLIETYQKDRHMTLTILGFKDIEKNVGVNDYDRLVISWRPSKDSTPWESVAALVSQVAAVKKALPIIVLSEPDQTDKHEAEARQAGAVGMTSSPADLLRMLGLAAA